MHTDLKAYQHADLTDNLASTNLNHVSRRSIRLIGRSPTPRNPSRLSRIRVAKHRRDRLGQGYVIMLSHLMWY